MIRNREDLLGKTRGFAMGIPIPLFPPSSGGRILLEAGVSIGRSATGDPNPRRPPPD